MDIILFLKTEKKKKKKIKTKNKLIGKTVLFTPASSVNYGHRVLGIYNHNFIILFIFFIVTFKNRNIIIKQIPFKIDSIYKFKVFKGI